MSGPGDVVGETLRLAIRWVHAVAAVAWVGGSLFYATALGPALRGASVGLEVERAVTVRFREVVEASLVALLVTGVLLSFERLSSPAVGAAYVAVLAVKLALALAMCWLAWELGWARRRRSAASRAARRQRTWPRWLAPSRLVLALGLAVMLLAIVLRQLFEAGLAARGQIT